MMNLLNVLGMSIVYICKAIFLPIAFIVVVYGVAMGLGSKHWMQDFWDGYWEIDV